MKNLALFNRFRAARPRPAVLLSLCGLLLLLLLLPAAVRGLTWNIETVEDIPDTYLGYDNSLALDSAGNPRISYYDFTNTDLKYAAWNGTSWDIETVDSDGWVGEDTSLALDANDNPHISYCDPVNDDLKYAAWNGTSWDIQVVDSAGNVGQNTSLALDDAGNPHISYIHVSNHSLKYAAWNGTSWDFKTVDSVGDNSWLMDNSLALDGDGRPRISYYHAIKKDLMYAAWNGTSWDVETIESDGSAGLGNSLVLNSAGSPRISYGTILNNEHHLKYAAWNGTSWDIETVISSDSTNYIGTASLVLDDAGNPHISFPDYYAYNLEYAAWNGTSWDFETVDSANHVGGYVSMALDGAGNPHISYVDDVRGSLMYATTAGAGVARLTIVKMVAGGPSLWSFDFTGDLGSFALDDGDDTAIFTDLTPGDYAFSEALTPDYTAAIACDNGDTSAGGSITVTLAAGDDVICTVSNTYVPPAELFMSANAAGTTADGLAYGPHDVLYWNGFEWSLFFDGDFAGLTPNGKAKHNINALWVPNPYVNDLDDEDIVLSFGQNRRHVPDIANPVDGMDLVWWNGSSFSFWFDGSDVDLTSKTQEKIDALHVLPGGDSPINGGNCLAYLLISTQGPGKVLGHNGQQIKFSGEDVLGFCMTNSGSSTAGLWHMVLDGSQQGMPKNSTTSISVSDDGQTMYLTTRSTFNVDAANGGHSSVYAYDFATEEFSGPYFVAADEGLPTHVNALHVVSFAP